MRKLIPILFLLTSCTISFQNISTHGTATDLVDENQEPTADLKADLQKTVSCLYDDDEKNICKHEDDDAAKVG